MLYSKAPITEATLDIRVSAIQTIPLDRLEALQVMLGEGYIEKQNLQFSEFLVQPEIQASAHRAQQIGFRFIHSDKRRIVQARIDGFAFSLLAPYESWESFSQEAQKLWARYREHIQPDAITRLAVRYINQLDVPSPTVELKDYLATVPEIAPGLPQVLERYFMQLVLRMDENQARAIINQGLVPPPIPQTTSIILDIDVFRDESVPQDEQGIWYAFEDLRKGKNRIFDASITERAKGMFK